MPGVRSRLCAPDAELSLADAAARLSSALRSRAGPGLRFKRLPSFRHELLDLTQFDPVKSEGDPRLQVILALMKAAREKRVMDFFEWLGRAVLKAVTGALGLGRFSFWSSCWACLSPTFPPSRAGRRLRWRLVSAIWSASTTPVSSRCVAGRDGDVFQVVLATIGREDVAHLDHVRAVWDAGKDLFVALDGEDDDTLVPRAGFAQRAAH